MNQREQFGLGRVVILAIARARQAAPPLEVARDAPAQRGGNFGDVRVLERRCGVELLGELSGYATVDPIEHECVEVQIQIQRTSESLHEDHRARAWMRDAVISGSPL